MSAGSLGIGLIGLGIHGARYALHLAAGDVAGAHLAGVWSRNRLKTQEAAKTHRVPAFSEPSELCRSPGVHAVAVVVPVGRHPDIVGEALAEGQPVLVEKPFAPDVVRGQALIVQAAALGLPLSVAHTLRFDPLLVALREAAAEPEWGRLRGFDLAQRLEPRDVSWEDDPELAGGGVLMQTGIHGLDALRFLLGANLEPTAARAARIHYRNVEDAITVHLRARGGRAGEGAEGVLATSKLGRSRHHRFSLFFDAGGLEADFVDRSLSVTRGRRRETRIVPPRSTIVEILAAFARHVRGEGPNPVPASEGLAAVRAAQESYAQIA